ncbi:MAG TPA: SagB/ThcOx family dehydrogenase [bacterium]|nr:SagB/ThcOx family dehydrogenase [bacterium]
MKNDDYIGDRFQELTRYSRSGLTGGGARPAQRAEPFKEYPGARLVPLGVAELPEGSLWRALAERRSRRAFTDEPMSLSALSLLVFAAQGRTAKAGKLILRTAPSAGGLYPVEMYLVINRVSDVLPGVYHYNVRRTALEAVREGDYGREISEAALGQGMCGRAAAVFVWTAVKDRCQYKYAQRGWRYIYLDAGHICQNAALAATVLGLGFCPIGAFFDDEMNALLGVDGESETSIYLAAAGPVKPGVDEE